MLNFPGEKRIYHVSNADPVLGPLLLITKEMVEKSISKMKIGKASGPSGVVTEMLKGSSDICSELIANLTNSIIHDNIVPSEWDDSFIISLFKGKGEALDRKLPWFETDRTHFEGCRMYY